MHKIYKGQAMKQQKDLTQIMTQNAIAVGTIVHEVLSVSDAILYAVDLTKEKKFKTLTCPGLDTKNRGMISDLCKSADLNLLNPPLREKGPTLDTSLTWAEYGIADTGTLMIVSDSEEIRLATMLAQIHIVMLPLSKIRPDTAGIEAELNAILKNDSPSYTAFITGASRTADIERVLTIGVHGPVELHLLLLQED
jgi:L-lactate dehydrogenase complex protein LldG